MTAYFYPTDDEGKCTLCKRRHHPGRGCPKMRKKLVSQRAHMDCFTSPNNCWVGDDATCPMKPRQAPPTYDLMVGDKVVASVEVENPTLVYFVKRDEPSKLLVGVDIDPVDLTMRVGHWPDGEEWQAVLETKGVEATS